MTPLGGAANNALSLTPYRQGAGQHQPLFGQPVGTLVPQQQHQLQLNPQQIGNLQQLTPLVQQQQLNNLAGGAGAGGAAGTTTLLNGTSLQQLQHQPSGAGAQMNQLQKLQLLQPNQPPPPTLQDYPYEKNGQACNERGEPVTDRSKQVYKRPATIT